MRCTFATKYAYNRRALVPSACYVHATPERVLLRNLLIVTVYRNPPRLEVAPYGACS